MTTKHDRLILLVIIALSVLLRVAVALTLGDSTPPAKDETSYSQLAMRLASGHGYSFAEPWYPFAPAGAGSSRPTPGRWSIAGSTRCWADRAGGRWICPDRRFHSTLWASGIGR